MAKTAGELAQEVIDENHNFPRTWSEIKKMVLQGMLKEREACAATIDEYRANRPTTAGGRLIAEECAIAIRERQ